MNLELTKVETALLDGLTESQRTFFDAHFSKVSPRRWVTNLKHYDETYSIQDALTICEVNFE